MQGVNPFECKRYHGPKGYFVLLRELARSGRSEILTGVALAKCMDIFVVWHGGTRLRGYGPLALYVAGEDVVGERLN